MKFKISIICFLLISIYCLSAVCAADLNQTADDIKTNDENDDSVVLNDYNSDVSDYDDKDDADWASIQELIKCDTGVKPTQQLVRIEDSLVRCDDSVNPFTPMPSIPAFPSHHFPDSPRHSVHQEPLLVNLDAGLKQSIPSIW